MKRKNVPETLNNVASAVYSEAYHTPVILICVIILCLFCAFPDHSLSTLVLIYNDKDTDVISKAKRNKSQIFFDIGF